MRPAILRAPVSALLLAGGFVLFGLARSADAAMAMPASGGRPGLGRGALILSSLAPFAEPAGDEGAMYLVSAGPIKPGVTLGPDSRPITLMAAQAVGVARATGNPKAYTIQPGEFTFNTEGAIGKAFGDAVISFVDAAGQSSLVFDGTEIVALAIVPVSAGAAQYQEKLNNTKAIAAHPENDPVTVTMTPFVQPGGNTFVFSNITVTYAGVEFLRKHEWSVSLRIFGGLNLKLIAETPPNSLKFIFLPGEPQP